MINLNHCKIHFFMLKYVCFIQIKKNRTQTIMLKKDVLEIRKQFSHENCCITRICGCYVDAEKEKRLEFKEGFLSLPEEETFKYFELFKQTLSGTVGKNLIPLEFPLTQEGAGGTQEFLLSLRNSKLQDDLLLNEFYDKIIEHYDFGEHYLILLIHATYDIPGKSSDGTKMFDASDEVYEHILCSICPVARSKAGLCYNSQDNVIEGRFRDWLVGVPAKGFLFPTFSDRTANIHEVLYFSKKPEELMESFIENLFGSSIPLTASTQKETFHSIISDTLGETCSYEVVKNLHENLNKLLEENKEAEEPLKLNKPDIKRLLEKSGADEERLEIFEQEFDSITAEDTTLLASNIANTKKFDIQTPNVAIHVNPDFTDLIETKIIDGRPCLVIPVDSQIEVNGLYVKIDPLEKQ